MIASAISRGFRPELARRGLRTGSLGRSGSHLYRGLAQRLADQYHRAQNPCARSVIDTSSFETCLMSHGGARTHRSGRAEVTQTAAPCSSLRASAGWRMPAGG